MHVEPETLHEVVDSVWSAMLGLSLTPSANPYTPNGHGRMSGTVTITGSWEAAVKIDLPVPVAREAAAVMFDMTDDELGDEEVLDALGELVNMIGGNIKGLAEGESKLSLPTVAQGGDFQVFVPNAEVDSEMVFDACNSQFQVQVLIRSES